MHDKKYQAGLFDTFLVAAYLYDDNRVKIVFSFAGDKNTIEIPLEDVIDSIDDEASCVRLSSTLSHQSRARRTERSPGSAPISAIYMVGGVFVLVCPLDAEE